VKRVKYSRRRRKGRGRGSYPAQLRCLAGGGNTEASGELREMDGDPSYFSSVSALLPSLSLLLSISVSNGFLPSGGGAAVVDSDSRRFLWWRRGR